MRSLALMFGFSALFLMASLQPAAAQDDVFLRGTSLTRAHVVFGTIDRVTGHSARLNLGYGHGLKTGDQLLAVRSVNDAVIPICGLFVTKTEPGHSLARIEGPFHPREGDFVLIHASLLDLWGRRNKLDRLAAIKLAREHSVNGYSTFDSNERLLDELARDESYVGRAARGDDPNTFGLDTTQRIGVLESRIGAVLPYARQLDEDAPQVTDATLIMLGQFAEQAQNPELLIALMETERLVRLQPVDRGAEVTDENAPLFRRVLLAWAKKALVPLPIAANNADAVDPLDPSAAPSADGETPGAE
ncbi:MAG: hypothetical protein R3B90_15340 [Planctomycetaceae bacterium]